MTTAIFVPVDRESMQRAPQAARPVPAAQMLWKAPFEAHQVLVESVKVTTSHHQPNRATKIRMMPKAMSVSSCLVTFGLTA